MKLTIILTVILIIESSDSIGVNPLKSAEEQLNTTIDAAKTQINQDLIFAKKKIDNVAAGLRETAESAGQVVYDQIRGLIDKFDEQLKKLEKTSGQVDVADCMTLAKTKDLMALGVMADVSTCIVEQLELGDGIPESLSKVTTEVLDNLTSVQHESHKCFQNVGFTAIPKATACAARMITKATWITANSVPETITTTAGLTNQMEKLPINVPLCTINNGIEILPLKYAELYNQVKKCIDEKISHIHS